ncbi:MULTISPECIES: hypothetical protein [unclassified Ruegeria]|uniref:hypothetical protein n=1 Tax=unclassified Ruegeria TaxID=2625375 RepID=UPI001488AB77|nr:MULTISPECIES: hypothetical protein [unclassified Ruegeria]
MSVSKFLLICSVSSVMLIAACSGPSTYPITGIAASASDPVMDMEMPGVNMGIPTH